MEYPKTYILGAPSLYTYDEIIDEYQAMARDPIIVDSMISSVSSGMIYNEYELYDAEILLLRMKYPRVAIYFNQAED